MQSQGARKEARLRNLVKLRAWAEQKARDAKRDIPEKMDIGLVGDGSSNSNVDTAAIASQNGTSTNNGDTPMANNGEIDPMIS